MIYTTPLSDDFADRLVQLILSRGLTPFEIAQTQIILPTRRACRTVKERFVQKSGNKPLLLPRLTPLYDLDFLDESVVPPAIGQAERVLLLARLCRAKPNINTAEKAVQVALGLSQLLDEFYQYETDLTKLEDLVPEQAFATHWHETIQFLDIIRSAWPQILKERGQIDEMDRRIRLIRAFAKKVPSIQTPVIAAGLDGAIPAVIDLIKALSCNDNNLILLNGLNKNLTKEDWRKIPPQHYQYPIKKLLDALKIFPEDVQSLSDICQPQEPLIHEALKPADQTDEWRQSHFETDVLKGVTRIDCNTPVDEALTIAALMRGVLETPGKTAALVTSDRTLSRRVILEMKRWDVTLDDSAGTPLHHTDVGVFLSLIADLGGSDGAGPALLSLCKHPLSTDGVLPALFRSKIREAEKYARKNNERLFFNAQTNFDNFIQLFTDKKAVSFSDMLHAHLELAEQLAETPDHSGSERLWNAEGGAEAFAFLTELLDKAPLLGDIDPASYPALMTLLLSGQTVRPKYGMHPRLEILGPIEARLSHPDVCFIGGLNEGVFPAIPETGPWINRPMRQALKMPPLESQIGSAGLDFAHCFCAKEVYVTRALKADGSPTIPSRFLSRIEAVLQASDIRWTPKKAVLSRLLDKPAQYDTPVRPSPKPPVSARPRKLSVTKVELWRRNPYAIYARYILNLYPLEELEKQIKPKMYGSALHAAFETFLRKHPKSTDAQLLYQIGLSFLREYGFSKTDIVFYAPQLKKIAAFFVAQHALRLPFIDNTLIEAEGKLTFNLPAGDFTLTGKADRIDIQQNGAAEIIDYKTGTVPSMNEVSAGYAPQLPLEGLLLTAGGFDGVRPPEATDIYFSYWKISGKEQAGNVTTLPSQRSKKTSEELIREAKNGVIGLVQLFDRPETPYECNPVAAKAPRYDDYAHLARAKEWAQADNEGEE